MRHNDHEIDKLFREKLQQQQEHHSFDKENDWSKLAMSLSVSGLVRTGVMSLGAKIFSYAAKTLLIGAMAFVPSVISLNSDENSTNNLASNQKRNNQTNQTENNLKNGFRNNISNNFLDKNLTENNTNLSEKNRLNIQKNVFKSDLEKDLEENRTGISNQNTKEISQENQQQSSLFILKNPTKNNVENNSETKENLTQNSENQTNTTKENALQKSQIIASNLDIENKIEISENQLVTNKENKKTSEKTLKGLNNHNPTSHVGNGQTETTDLIAKDKLFVKTQTTAKNTDLLAKDKSFLNIETSENQLVASKENKEKELFVKTQTTTDILDIDKDKENTVSASTRHFLTKINLFENYFSTDFEVKNREIKPIEITQIVKKEKFAQKFQITLFSPIGTNLKAQKSKHYASVGILTSISAGVEGAEISGLGNISTGKVEGLQVSGLANISRGETKGVQIAGLVNINKEKVRGLQIAGFANVSKNKVKGVQIASVANISNEQVDGAQVAVLANISKKKVRGLQIAAIANATDTLVGAQIGLVNISKNKARGLQLGLVNIVGENNKVLTIGLVNIVKKGGHSLVEISTSEALYGNISLKTGVRKFYNIFAVGSRLTENHNQKQVLMAYGYGIGTEWDFKGKYNISGELMLYALAPDMKFNKNEKGILTQAKIMLGQKLSKNWGVFGGVTFNMLNSPSGVNIIDKPFTVFNNFKIKDGNVTSWTGLQVGARYFL